MSTETVLPAKAELKGVLARARAVARFYAGKRVTSVEAVALVLDRLDDAERQLSYVRSAFSNGGSNGRAA